MAEDITKSKHFTKIQIKGYIIPNEVVPILPKLIKAKPETVHPWWGYLINLSMLKKQRIIQENKK